MQILPKPEIIYVAAPTWLVTKHISLVAELAHLLLPPACNLAGLL